MPRSSSPSKPRNITTMPIRISEQRNLPALIPERPSFLQTMKEGVALGVGSSIGHRIVGAIMGPPQIQTSQVQTVDKKKEEYEQCMKDTNDKAGCEHILRSKY
jgi:hypothetical protein